MSPLSIAAIVALVAGLVAGTGAWQVQNWRYGAKEKERIEAQVARDRNNRRIAEAASGGFENDRTKTGDKFRTIYKDRDVIVERPVYRNICIDDDGLRLINRAVGTGNSSQPEAAVPSPAASAQR